LAALSIISPKVGGVFVVVSVAAADIVDKFCLRDGSSFWAGLYVVAMTENQEEARAKGFDYFSQPRHQSKHTRALYPLRFLLGNWVLGTSPY
jgi:hypothetical protein